MNLPKEWDEIRQSIVAEVERKPGALIMADVKMAVREAVERCYALHSKPPKLLTDAEIARLHIDVFGPCADPAHNIKFARAIEAAAHAKQREPEVVKFRAAKIYANPPRIEMLPVGRVTNVHVNHSEWEWLEPPQEFEVKV